ncbi:MAG TPA: endolytic transglycosylase MltG [Candidatus Dormibacteraeota bacterium]|nr:endolytic transglycosylase MltG [Candidatus Dormibacteraeota bacterium]
MKVPVQTTPRRRPSSGRRKRRGGRGLAVLLILLVLIGFGVDRGYSWVNWQISTPVGGSGKAVLLTVASGEGPDQLAQTLAEKDLIRSQRVFLYYFHYRGAEARLEAGTFALARTMSMAQIVSALTGGPQVEVTVRLTEGYPMKLMASQAQAQHVGTAAEYLAAAGDPGAYDETFLKGWPSTAPQNLEGFLYGDTYALLPDSTPKELIARQLQRFGQLVTPAMQAEAGKATSARPAENLYSIVTLASIVEREVNTDKDRPLVCDVFYNRLQAGIPLGSDATVLYAVGKWSGTPTQEDLQVNSPYNTRKFPGLPPGPISNPGIASIQGCINPTKTDYMYFFTDPKGAVHYAVTYQQFLQQQQQYGLSGQ